MPLAAWLDSWNENRYTIVEEIKIRRWPYGVARGYPTINGTPSDIYTYYPEWNSERIIHNAGVYRWKHVNVKLVNGTYVKDKMMKKKVRVSKKTKIYYESTIIQFGKYKGSTIQQIFDKDFSYFRWLIFNVNIIVIEPDCMAKLLERKGLQDQELFGYNRRNYKIFSESHTKVNNGKNIL
ncbi:hypothetical protein M0P98_00430 [bacterium]|nr:hypothetical protein [bacterium]